MLDPKGSEEYDLLFTIDRNSTANIFRKSIRWLAGPIERQVCFFRVVAAQLPNEIDILGGKMNIRSTYGDLRLKWGRDHVVDSGELWKVAESGGEWWRVVECG